MVRLGWATGGLKTVVATEDAASADTSLWGAMLGGLVAGFNTCALSMFLLFLSIVLEAKRGAGLLSVCFLGAKFVCYLLIGFGLLELLQRFDPQWLRPAARIVMTALGGALILLNLWDAWQARHERYGQIRNQLPTGLRGWLRRVIRALTAKRLLVPSVIALGFVVALGEFLCAGQFYLMQLLRVARSGVGGAASLVAYCAAFIVPSALLCALILGGRSQARVSAFLLEHMAVVKLVTAVAMLALIVSAWLL